MDEQAREAKRAELRAAYPRMAAIVDEVRAVFPGATVTYIGRARATTKAIFEEAEREEGAAVTAAPANPAVPTPAAASASRFL